MMQGNSSIIYLRIILILVRNLLRSNGFFLMNDPCKLMVIYALIGYVIHLAFCVELYHIIFNCFFDC